MPILTYTDLHCPTGKLDEVFHAAISRDKGGYEVMVAYGQRGSVLTRETKTSAPTTVKKAFETYKNLTTEKKNIGFVSAPGVSGNVFRLTKYAYDIPTVSQPASYPSIADSQNKIGGETPRSITLSPLLSTDVIPLAFASGV